MITLERQSILSTEIAAANSRTSVAAILARIGREFGFRHYLLARAASATDAALARLIAETNLPNDYIREFDRRRLLHQGPVMQQMADYALPYCWMLDDKWAGRKASPDFCQLQREHDMTTGVDMALHSMDGIAFHMRMGGSRPRLTQAELNEIGMLILQTFSVFDRLRRSQRGAGSAPLTTRELEVVRWTSQGKTSSEIGQILSLSDHTINAYLTNAIKKLDCVNRTQLVATALRMRLIA